MATLSSEPVENIMSRAIYQLAARITKIRETVAIARAAYPHSDKWLNMYADDVEDMLKLIDLLTSTYADKVIAALQECEWGIPEWHSPAPDAGAKVCWAGGVAPGVSWVGGVAAKAPAPVGPSHVTPAGYDVMKCAMGTCDHDAPAEGAEQWWHEHALDFPEAQDWWGGEEQACLCKILNAYAASLREQLAESQTIAKIQQDLKELYREALARTGEEAK